MKFNIVCISVTIGLLSNSIQAAPIASKMAGDLNGGGAATLTRRENDGGFPGVVAAGDVTSSDGIVTLGDGSFTVLNFSPTDFVTDLADGAKKRDDILSGTLNTAEKLVPVDSSMLANLAGGKPDAKSTDFNDDDKATTDHKATEADATKDKDNAKKSNKDAEKSDKDAKNSDDTTADTQDVAEDN